MNKWNKNWLKRKMSDWAFGCVKQVTSRFFFFCAFNSNMPIPSPTTLSFFRFARSNPPLIPTHFLYFLLHFITPTRLLHLSLLPFNFSSSWGKNVTSHFISFFIFSVKIKLLLSLVLFHDCKLGFEEHFSRDFSLFWLDFNGFKMVEL